MTNRVKALIVILDNDYRDDDADEIVNAIEVLKGVLNIKKHIFTSDDVINRERIKYEIRNQIGEILD